MEAHALDSYLAEPLDSILAESIKENNSQDLDVRLNQGAARNLLWDDADAFSAERFYEDGDFFFFEGGTTSGKSRQNRP